MRIIKLWNYLQNRTFLICNEYKESTFELIKNIKNNPKKFATFGLFATTTLVLNKNIPNKVDFDNDLVINIYFNKI